MKNILLVPNADKDKGLQYTKQVIDYIGGRAELVLSHKYLDFCLKNVTYKKDAELYQNVHLIIVLGGDGTILGVARESAKHKIPVLGINLGRLGFLAEIETPQIAECIEMILNDQYIVEERMMLRARWVKDRQEALTFTALNDIVVSRASFSRLIDLNVFVNGEFVDDFKADGIIVATPTGSTAYSLSAGGPIVDPTVQTLIITPICPHKMYSRTIMVPENKEISIQLNEKYKHHAMITVDGQEKGLLALGDQLQISKTEETMRLVRIYGSRFYSVLRQKLTEKDH